MPRYEYRCEACNSDFEVEQSIKDKPEAECPQCNASSMKRLIGRTSFALKGSGWAADNYSSKK